MIPWKTTYSFRLFPNRRQTSILIMFFCSVRAATIESNGFDHWTFFLLAQIEQWAPSVEFIKKTPSWRERVVSINQTINPKSVQFTINLTIGRRSRTANTISRWRSREWAGAREWERYTHIDWKRKMVHKMPNLFLDFYHLFVCSTHCTVVVPEIVVIIEAKNPMQETQSIRATRMNVDKGIKWPIVYSVFCIVLWIVWHDK